MKFKMLKIGGAAFLILAIFGFLAGINASADQLSEKEQWVKDNAILTDHRTIDPPVILDHGGPDGGGYYFIDSEDDANNAPVYGWIDISSIGTEITTWNGSVDDGYVTGIPLSMTFNFYGTDYSSITVSTNGWISFLTQTSSYLSNATIPTAANPNAIIAVEWDDLDGGAVGHCYYYYDAAEEQFIVSWVGWPYYPDATGPAHDLQVILKSNGDIIAQYGTNAGDWQTEVTVGIENENGAIGTLVSYNQAYLHSDYAIYYGLTPPIYADHDVRPIAFIAPSGFGSLNEPVTPIVRYMNAGISAESFPGHLSVNHNGLVYDQTVQISNLNPTENINITYPDFIPTEEGAYEFVAVSELSGDGNPSNDTLRMTFTVYADIYFDDFEAGDGFFTGDNDWQWGEPTNADGPGAAHSGTNLWAVGLAANYQIGPLLSTLISPPIGLGSNAVLSFWHWYDTENTFDGGNVKISTDGGGTWTLLIPAEAYDGTLSSNFQNPIGGEEAFFGASTGWEYETFDLSAYAGSSAQFKFDFGSDSSVDGAGWFVDDFTVIGGGGVNPGWVAGTVTDLASGSPINGAIVTVASRRDTTDALGLYSLELFPGSYNLTAIAQYHNDLTVNGVAVVEGDTTTQNFALTGPVIQVNTTAIDTTIVQGTTGVFTRSITNTGNGPLDFSVSVSMGGRVLTSGVNVQITPASTRDNDSRFTEIAPNFQPGNPHSILDFGDEVMTFDPQTPTNDEACLGMEFDGTYFWVTGRHPVDEVHKLHKFDRTGAYIESFDQGTSSTWGWRDLAFDGTYLYGSDENGISQIDPATGQEIGSLPMPNSISPPMRGFAYDPATDHFWAANFGSNIIEFDRAGQTINSYANTLAIYGLAWDDASADGPWLWTFSQDGVPALLVSQFDPNSGSYTGNSFVAIDHNGGNDDIAGGACFTTAWDPSFGVFFGLVQGQLSSVSYDLVQGYEITPFSNWLVVAPTSGTLQASESVNLTITIDFSGDNIVPESTYTATISVMSNAQGTPQIPVTAHVGPTGIDDDTPGLPLTYSLSQNYPNPFNPATDIAFALPKAGDVRLEVFNVLGQRVAVLIDAPMQAGYHIVTWNAAKEASGLYFYKLSAGAFNKIHSMSLVK